MKRKQVLIVALAILLAAGITTTLTLAQGPTEAGTALAPLANAGTAFTYQGQLKKSGSPVNGACDLQFGLWDALSGGSLFGGAQTILNVGVVNGLFTAQLDSGPNAFNGEARWLEMTVRCPAGSGSYTPLTPRQALTPAPMALVLPGLYTQQNATSPNVIGGYSGNSVTAGGVGATIGGGGASGAGANRVTDSFGTVGGGRSNQAGDNSGTTSDMAYSTVGGGLGNTASGYLATIGGGDSNTANGNSVTIGGGSSNTTSGRSSTISGGESNIVSDWWATIGGGQNNTASGQWATVGGGYTNTVSKMYTTVAGGGNNTASGLVATVGGGDSNVASGDWGTVGGGVFNIAGGNRATVGGGRLNTASGYAATVPGGEANTASMTYTLAAGRRANAIHTGAFVWADSASADFASTAANQFLIRANGGVGINTNAPANGGLQIAKDFSTTGGYGQIEATGATNPTKRLTLGFDTTNNLGWIQASTTGVGYNSLAFNPSGSSNVTIGTTSDSGNRLTVLGDVRVGTSGANGCIKGFGGAAIAGACSSDARLKQNITAFPNVLDKVTRLQPVYYNWRAAEYPAYHFDGSVRGYGVIAQEVEQVLPELVGADEQGYKTVNYSEIPLLLVQAIKDLRAEKDTQIAELKALNAAQQAEIVQLREAGADMNARLAALERTVQARNVSTPSDNNPNLAVVAMGALLGIVVMRRPWQGRAKWDAQLSSAWLLLPC